jgi:hypothetical protein
MGELGWIEGGSLGDGRDDAGEHLAGRCAEIPASVWRQTIHDRRTTVRT